MRTFYLLALIAWIVIGSLWSKKTFCGSDAKPSASSKVAGAAAASKGGCDMSLLFATDDFSETTTDNFHFSVSKYTLKSKPSAEMQTTLTKVADFLNENPSKSLSIEGLYFSKETNTSSEENLGLARAKTIKTYLVREFGVNENQISTGAQKTKNACYSKESKTLRKGAIANLVEVQ